MHLFLVPNTFAVSRKEVSSCNVSKLPVAGKKNMYAFFMKSCLDTMLIEQQSSFSVQKGKKRFLNEPL